MRILVFGDGITQGFFDSRGGWVQRLASDIHNRTLLSMSNEDDFNGEVYNLGISGSTIGDINDRIEQEVKSRRLSDDTETIVIAAGINDSVLIANRVFKEVYDFQEELEKLVSILKGLSAKVVFIGCTAVDESLCNPWKFSSKGKQCLNNRINLFEDTVKQVSLNSNIPFIPVHDRFLAELEKGHQLLSDGLHPNNLGHEFIYQIIKPELEELLV